MIDSCTRGTFECETQRKDVLMSRGTGLHTHTHTYGERCCSTLGCAPHERFDASCCLRRAVHVCCRAQECVDGQACVETRAGKTSLSLFLSVSVSLSVFLFLYDSFFPLALLPFLSLFLSLHLYLCPCLSLPTSSLFLSESTVTFWSQHDNVSDCYQYSPLQASSS